jgi:hypothetical protein
MNSIFRLSLFLFVIFIHNFKVEAIDFTSWKFTNLNSLGECAINPEGNPTLITINNDTAWYFDGTDDRVVVDTNPLIGLNEFTFEVVFRIDEGGVSEQKFIHLQANPDIRILFEIEFKENGRWYMENFIKAENGESIHLMDSTIDYPVNRWYHAAIVYKNNEFKQYINYNTLDIENLSWTPPTDGSVSVGSRMNQVNYFTGAVREIRFADMALDSSEFLFYDELLEQNEVFLLDNLDSINGHEVQVFGNPQIIDTDLGKAMEFDGTEDGIYILTNPLDTVTKFTIETIIKPYDVYPENNEPRYLHIEDPTDGNRRITMELRLNDNHEWYFDGFIKSPVNNLTLIDENLTHPIEDKWEHLAITYDDSIFTTYVNYKSELTGKVTYLPISKNGKMSVGMRMNKVAYFNGAFHKIRVTHAVLDTSEFMMFSPDTTNNNPTDIFDTSIEESSFDISVFPNPASASSIIKINSAKSGFIKIDLFDVTGKQMDVLVDNYVNAGITEIEFQTDKYPKGIYFLRSTICKILVTKKILIH